MAFIQNGQQALLAAVLIGLLGGMANAACIDIAMRACPPGLQGTLMMMMITAAADGEPNPEDEASVLREIGS